jgi:hypothetical protein
MTEKQISRVLCSVTQKLKTGLISFEMRNSAVFNTIEVRLSSFEILANIYLFPYFHQYYRPQIYGNIKFIRIIL